MEEMRLASSIIGNVLQRNTLSLPSIESTYAFETSLEGAMTELWRKVKNGTINGLTYLGKYFGWVFTQLSYIQGKVLTAIVIGLNDVLYFGSVSSWVRLIGANEFWAQYKWNEYATFNINHDKVIAAAIQQTENAVEFFKNYADYVETFYNGTDKVLTKLGKEDKNIAKEVENYNASVNVKLTRIFEKCFPTNIMGGNYSKPLLGGKVLYCGDLRFANMMLGDVEVLGMTGGFKKPNQSLDLASKEIRLDTKKFKEFIDVAKKACNDMNKQAGQIKASTVAIEEKLDAIDKMSYEQYLSSADRSMVRNFVRDVSLMANTITTGAANQYLEVFIEKMSAAETLIKK